MKIGPSPTLEATGDALGETIGGMFDIPLFGIEDQMADALTVGAESTEIAGTDTSSEDTWDPFAGW